MKYLFTLISLLILNNLFSQEKISLKLEDVYIGVFIFNSSTSSTVDLEHYKRHFQDLDLLDNYFSTSVTTPLGLTQNRIVLGVNWSMNQLPGLKLRTGVFLNSASPIAGGGYKD